LVKHKSERKFNFNFILIEDQKFINQPNSSVDSPDLPTRKGSGCKDHKDSEEKTGSGSNWLNLTGFTKPYERKPKASLDQGALTRFRTFLSSEKVKERVNESS
jgi:hypothetical protein